LLRELLEQTEADIYCLVRSSSPDEALGRILGNLRHYSLDGSASSRRIIPVCGDLSQPLFGLPEDGFAELAETVDVVYHNGAETNPADSYAVLKPVNVDGTVQILRLATLKKVKPVHFVSTIALFAGQNDNLLDGFDEDGPPKSPGSLQQRL
jgi:thioester reductase-like protein